jgi:hypothetical protein
VVNTISASKSKTNTFWQEKSNATVYIQENSPQHKPPTTRESTKIYPTHWQQLLLTYSHK